MKSFSKKSIETLKHYVYALVDPETNEIFYVGRGKGNRGLQHLKITSDDESEKKKTIAGIRARGQEPRLDIIRYGLDSKSVIEVEAAIIDSLGLGNITNEIRGFDTSRGRANSKDLNTQLGGRPLNVKDIKDNVILFFCHKSLALGNNHYDSTRQFWPLSENRINKVKPNGELYYEYAFTMKGNTVMNIFKILQWFPAGTTISSREYKIYNKESGKWEFIGAGKDSNEYKNFKNTKKRWEFIGSKPPESVLKKYKNRLLIEDSKPLKAQQNGFRYLN